MHKTPHRRSPPSHEVFAVRRRAVARRAREGAAGVEGVLVLPIFVLLLLLIFWANDAFNAAAAAVEGARQSVLMQTATPSCVGAVAPAPTVAGGAAPTCGTQSVTLPGSPSGSVVTQINDISLSDLNGKLPSIATAQCRQTGNATARTNGMGSEASINFTATASSTCLEPSWTAEPDFLQLSQTEQARRANWGADGRGTAGLPSDDVRDAVFCDLAPDWCPGSAR